MTSGGSRGTSIWTSTPPVATGTTRNRPGRAVDVLEPGGDISQADAGVTLEAPLRRQPHAIVAHPYAEGRRRTSSR